MTSTLSTLLVSTLLATAAAVAPPPRRVVPPVTRRIATSTTLGTPTAEFDVEKCILNAKSEDEVSHCMAIFDEFEPAEESAESLPLDALDACILGATCEDDVQDCIQANAEAEARAELASSIEQCVTQEEMLAITSGKQPAAAPILRDPIEECIVNAASEDEVQECLQTVPPASLMDGTDSEGDDELDQCILGAPSEDAVQACLQASEARAAAFEALRTGLVECIHVATCEEDVEACMLAAEAKMA